MSQFTLTGGTLIINTLADWGNVVRDRRIELGLSQKEVADSIGKSRWWVVNFETGSAGTASNESTMKLLRHLGLFIEIGWEPEFNDPDPMFMTPSNPDPWESER